MKENSRRRIIILLKILWNQTDEDHMLSSGELYRILEEYGEKPYRGTLAEDISALQAAGFEIRVTRSSQNYYQLIERDLEKAELKLLIDSVKSSKFITKKKADELAEKISRINGSIGAADLTRNIYAENRIRNGNTRLFLIIDTINNAISQNKQLSFLYYHYDEQKQQVLKHGGKPYRLHPFFLVWNGEYYYLVGMTDSNRVIIPFRVDRIAGIPEILDQYACSMPPGFDPDQYLNSTIHMFGNANNDPVPVRLRCENSVANAIIDRFGIDVEMNPIDESHFLAKVFVIPTTVFYGWIFGFDGKVEIISPETVRNDYIEMIKRAEKKTS